MGVKTIVMALLIFVSFIISSLIISIKLDLLSTTKLGVYFIGSMWLLPYISTVLFMPLMKLREGILKIFDQG